MTNDWHTRPETLADHAVVHDITLAAFDTAVEADLLDALRDDPAWIDGLSLVASDPQGQVVGHAVLTRCTIGDSPAVILGPVSVLPARHNSGAGSAVVRALLQAAKELGENHVVVVGHPDYYPRFGFARASTVGISAPIDIPDEAMMALTLDDTHPLPSGIVRWSKAFGV